MNWHLGEPLPAIVAHPAAASLDEAHGAIEQWEFYTRKRLDSAQRLSVEHMLAEHADGNWAASSTGRAVSRQNGKGDEIEVVELWGITQRGEAILHTAHEAATAASAHGRLKDLVLSHRDLRRKIGRNSRGQEAIQSWNGNYRIQMADDSFIVHRTRTAAIGRGLDDISRLVVDEAQHAQVEELASATPILAANPNPQKNYIGSAGIFGRSAFWWRLRREGLLGSDPRFAWLEHSMETVWLDEKGKVHTSLGDITDRRLWGQANPAYLAGRISEDFLLGQLRDLGPEAFGREHGCVWDPEPGTADGVIPMDLWHELRREPRKITGAYAFDVAPEGRSTSIALSDGTYGEIVKHAPGTNWVVDLVKSKDVEIYCDPAGPNGAIADDLERAGVTVHRLTFDQSIAAAAGLLTAVHEKKLTHVGQSILDDAVDAADRREVRDGAWLWSRKKSNADISPLVALTVARWAAGIVADDDGPVFAW